tara:strand:- start:315 stop:470 length:156 start_codon:yes stop_codon:yes gene_type:complete
VVAVELVLEHLVAQVEPEVLVVEQQVECQVAELQEQETLPQLVPLKVIQEE